VRGIVAYFNLSNIGRFDYMHTYNVLFKYFQTWKILRENQLDLRQYNVTDLIPETDYIITIQARTNINNKTYTTSREEIFCETGNLLI